MVHHLPTEASSPSWTASLSSSGLFLTQRVRKPVDLIGEERQQKAWVDHGEGGPWMRPSELSSSRTMRRVKLAARSGLWKSPSDPGNVLWLMGAGGEGREEEERSR